MVTTSPSSVGGFPGARLGETTVDVASALDALGVPGKGGRSLVDLWFSRPAPLAFLIAPCPPLPTRPRARREVGGGFLHGFLQLRDSLPAGFPKGQ